MPASVRLLEGVGGSRPQYMHTVSPDTAVLHLSLACTTQADISWAVAPCSLLLCHRRCRRRIYIVSQDSCEVRGSIVCCPTHWL